MASSETFDIVIIGGGINGCGIARDAAGRGLSVLLCEMNDLASGTSSWSTKLIHGGLRYLEYYDFRLVREALGEREILWRIAPHIIKPLRFVLPHHAGLRPAWLLRVGLFLYDHLGGRRLLPPARSLDLARDEAGRPLQANRFSRGFEYSDCLVDDARLVVLNARDAADRGAAIHPRTKAIAAEVIDGIWRVALQDTVSGVRQTVHARTIVNAAGPWVADVFAQVAGLKAKASVRLVQGSHIVTQRLFDHDRAYIFQNADGRIVFAIPWQRDFTLIGTTDRDYAGDPALMTASAEEIRYLCDTVNDYLACPITPADVVWTFAGVRPLYDDGASEAKAATRDYVLELDTERGAPLLSIFGGKITTYRRLAEDALARLAPHLASARAKSWTGDAPLPGGDFGVFDGDAARGTLLDTYPFLSRDHATRMVDAYGTCARDVLGDAAKPDDLGRDFGATLTGREVLYLMRREWAMTAEDVVWRRSKLGLRLDPAQVAEIEQFMRNENSSVVPANAGTHTP